MSLTSVAPGNGFAAFHGLAIADVAFDQPAQQVLGVGLEDLGAGVARVWGLPEALQRCIRKPLGSPPMRPPEKGVERLRWVARAANEVASTLLLADAQQAHEDPVKALNLAVPEIVAHVHLDLDYLRAKLDAAGDLSSDADLLLH